MLIYLLALLITILVEFLIFWVFVRKDSLKLFLYSALINSFTLPLAVYSYQNVLKNFYVTEILVVFAESIVVMLLLRTKYSKALLISFAANFVTALISFLWSLFL